MDRDERKKRAGERLTECIKLRRMKYSEFVSIQPGGYLLSEPYLYQMRTGLRSFDNYAYAFAKTLNVSCGYLLGVDDFKAKNYREFLEIEDNQAVFSTLQKEEDKYNYYISPSGYHINAAIGDPDSVDSFSVKHGDELCWVDAEDMNNFYNELREFISKSMDVLILKSRNKAYISDDDK